MFSFAVTARCYYSLRRKTVVQKERKKEQKKEQPSAVGTGAAAQKAGNSEGLFERPADVRMGIFFFFSLFPDCLTAC